MRVVTHAAEVACFGTASVSSTHKLRTWEAHRSRCSWLCPGAVRWQQHEPAHPPVSTCCRALAPRRVADSRRRRSRRAEQAFGPPATPMLFNTVRLVPKLRPACAVCCLGHCRGRARALRAWAVLERQCADGKRPVAHRVVPRAQRICEERVGGAHADTGERAVLQVRARRRVCAVAAQALLAPACCRTSTASRRSLPSTRRCVTHLLTPPRVRVLRRAAVAGRRQLWTRWYSTPHSLTTSHTNSC